MIRVDSKPKPAWFNSTFVVTVQDILALVSRIDSNTFEFDGVTYFYKEIDLCIRRGLLRRLLYQSRILSGIPQPNSLSYLFIYETPDGSRKSVLTSNKYWVEERTVQVVVKTRYELLVIQKRLGY